MAILKLVPRDEAIAALKMTASELRGLARFTDFAVSNELRERRELVAAVLQDLAGNISAGVSQLVRSTSGAVLIETAEISPAKDLPWADTARWQSDDEA